MKINIVYSDKKRVLELINTQPLIVYKNRNGKFGIILTKFENRGEAYDFIRMMMRFKPWYKIMYLEDGKIVTYDMWWYDGNPDSYKPLLKELITQINQS